VFSEENDMVKLEETPVAVRLFRSGSVEEVEAIENADGSEEARKLVRVRFPNAVFVRCCEHESDGGCVFAYSRQADLEKDESDLKLKAERGDEETPADYGRWVALISSAENDEPACKRPSSPDQE
jgi:hypothetical protein